MRFNCIFSVCCKPVSNKITQCFLYSCAKAEKKQRVTTSNIKNLLKKIRSSPDKISLEELWEVKANTKRIRDVLYLQKSNLFKEKESMVTKALSVAEGKLSQQAKDMLFQQVKNKLADERISQVEAKIKLALEEAKKRVRKLSRQLKAGKGEIKEMIRKLPTEEMKNKACDIINCNSYTSSDRYAAITQELFPMENEILSKGEGYIAIGALLGEKVNNFRQDETEFRNTKKFIEKAQCSLSLLS